METLQEAKNVTLNNHFYKDFNVNCLDPSQSPDMDISHNYTALDLDLYSYFLNYKQKKS